MADAERSAGKRVQGGDVGAAVVGEDAFDSLMGSSGGVVIQPVLGRAADVYSYSTSLVFGALIQLAAAPFLVASRREHAPADTAITLEASTAVPADTAA
jgi:hypothetical protein